MRRYLWILAALAPATEAQAGPWTKSFGEAYAKISEGVFIAGEFVDARARQTSDVEHLSFTTALYAEVGLAPNFHAQIYLPHVTGRNAYKGGYDYLSFGGGDLIAGLQYSPGLLNIPHAVRVDVKVPLYGIAPDPRFPARGDGQLDATIWLSAGAGFDSMYFFGEVGHRFRTEAYPTKADGLSFGDSFVFQAQAGTTIAGFFLAANLGGVVPYAVDETTKGYLNAGVAAGAPVFGPISLEASFDGTVWASNSSHGISATLGASYKL